jgi:cyanophycinase
VVARPARIDLAHILETSRERWGADGRSRYAAILAAAMRQVAAAPEGPLVRTQPELRAGLRSFHIRHAQGSHAARVRRPFTSYYRVADDGVIKIVRVLHERMEPGCPKPTDSRAKASNQGVRASRPMRICATRSLLVLLFSFLASTAGLSSAQSRSTHGPVRGSLVLQGGVGLNQAIVSTFVALAGGPRAHIVVIPTASVGDAGPPGMATSLARRMKESFGVAAVTVVHTNDRAEADADSFIEPIRGSTGVWMLGGFPERLVHAYLGTKVERAINDLLDRGGVVGGESAGAMIQGSWLDTEDNDGFSPDILAVIRTHASGAGFGLLTNAGIFPHFDKRGAAAAIKESAADPSQLAIGIDEETALVVSGAVARVVGSGTASMYDGARRGAPQVVVLRSGDRYDLTARRKE